MVTKLMAVAVLAAACASTSSPGTTPPPNETVPPAASGDPAAVADSIRNSFTVADVEFMTGMIAHHAQALVMARMIPTHTSNGPLQVLAGRIIVGQNDEIAIMQNWLRNNGQLVPEPDTTAAGVHAMHGGGHSDHELMPGMLTADQMAELDAARDEEFDRLFLTYMIQHHQGALTMVQELFATYGAAQNDLVFKIASDIGADQTSEIERMQLMLRETVFGPTESG
ncbi:MAG TPA: DUF305 domain-containing protein [Gemmatimonadota bacterium]|nr:DUF305 domain-containing protein [Gemmatimonadota bacterium]